MFEIFKFDKNDFSMHLKEKANMLQFNIPIMIARINCGSFSKKEPEYMITLKNNKDTIEKKLTCTWNFSCFICDKQ